MADSIMSEASTVPRKATMTRATITTTKTPVRYANRAERVKEMCAGSLGWFESKSIVLSKYCSHATNCSASRLSKAWEISGVRTGLGSVGECVVKVGSRWSPSRLQEGSSPLSAGLGLRKRPGQKPCCTTRAGEPDDAAHESIGEDAVQPAAWSVCQNPAHVFPSTCPPRARTGRLRKQQRLHII